MSGHGTTSACRGCGAERFPTQLDLGRQPLCNRFLASPDAGEYTHPLRFGQCARCGLVQILTPVPVDELRPRFPWISYQEPESHLDDLVARLAALPGVGGGTVAGALSYKDDSTLARLQARGVGRAWRVDPAADLGCEAARAEIETVQDRLASGGGAGVLRRHPPADLLLARHIVEHADRMPGFFASVRALVRPGGYLVAEAPDSERAFRLGDYSSLWEEHMACFTPATFRAFFAPHGFTVLETLRYPYPFEDSLVAIARRDPGPPAAAPAEAAPEEAARFAAFAEGLPRQRDVVRGLLARHRAGGGGVALLGAGHAAATFLNLLGLADLVDFVVDDNPHKAGLFMPGSRLPILPSRMLLDRGVRLCLLAVGSGAEDRVLERNPEFLARGGRFASIYPASGRALLPPP